MSLGTPHTHTEKTLNQTRKENNNETAQGLHHHQPRRPQMATRRNALPRRQAMAQGSMDRRNANLPNALGACGMVREGRAHRA
nr:MAG TPA_asm: hypothetical protein [Caudoviricetes sp.]